MLNTRGKGVGLNSWKEDQKFFRKIINGRGGGGGFNKRGGRKFIFQYRNNKKVFLRHSNKSPGYECNISLAQYHNYVSKIKL